MCGIVAVIGNPKNTSVDLFNSIFSASIVRGKDSAGVFGININKKINYIKDVCYPFELMMKKEYKNIINNSTEIMVGHARSATKGIVSEENAHPFQYKHITLVHNGTLISKMNVKKASIKNIPETDSETIAIHIAENGIEKTWRELHGDAALVWWDDRKKRLFFIRNDKRPLNFSLSNDEKQMFIASEDWMYMDVLFRNNEKIKKNDIWVPAKDYLHELWIDPVTKKVNIRSEKLKDYWYIDKTKAITTSNTVTSEPTFWQKISGRWVKNTDNNCNIVSFNSKEKEKFGNAVTLISYDDFLKTYKNCNFCGSSLKDEYEGCTILDEKLAVCYLCCETGKQNNINISTAVHGV